MEKHEELFFNKILPELSKSMTVVDEAIYEIYDEEGIIKAVYFNDDILKLPYTDYVNLVKLCKTFGYTLVKRRFINYNDKIKKDKEKSVQVDPIVNLDEDLLQSQFTVDIAQDKDNVISNRVISFGKNSKNENTVQMRLRIDKAGKVLEFAEKNREGRLNIKLKLLTTPVKFIKYDVAFLDYSLNELNSRSGNPLEVVFQFLI